ncbi:MAG: SMP-30/gluconolactonase/LRE family protein [Rubrivivax sp.]|nr:SMP-30/gluconolactonase/LRE family protein [Rubrivivax sp.]
MSDKSSEGTAALDKALDVLEAVGTAPAGLSQSELGERLKLPRTTLYRLLGTLVQRGLLRRDPLRRVYCLGMRCFDYARKAYAMPDLVAAAGIELRALRDMTGETTYLSTLDGLEVVALERCDGAHPVRSNSEPGVRKPLHCTSQGKAILAALPTERRDAIVKDLALTAVTPHSITDRRRLQAELRLTANRGWSIDDEEIVPGVRCCGAPIVDAQGQVRGAISVAGPAFRLTLERLELIGPEVVDAARRIGAQLSATRSPAVEGPVRVLPGDWAFEGRHPVWLPGPQRLLWADALAPNVHRASMESDQLLVACEAPIEALLPLVPGAAVFSQGLWTRVDSSPATPAPLSGLPRRRLNACTVGPHGELWGCLSEGDRWRVAALGADGEPQGGWRLGEPVTAMAWDGDGHHLFLAAAASGTLYVATLGQPNLRRLATVPKGSGELAGLAVDEAGGVWSALRGGWSVVRFESDGSVDQVVPLPVPAPSDLAFGGATRHTLFVTTARDAVNREALEAAPLSGRLLAIEVARAGVLVQPLAV